MVGDLPGESYPHDRHLKVPPSDDNIECPPEQMRWLLNRLDEPKRVEEVAQLDCVDIIRVVEVNVEVTGDDDRAAVEDKELQHGREFIVEHRGDRTSTINS